MSCPRGKNKKILPINRFSVLVSQKVRRIAMAKVTISESIPQRLWPLHNCVPQKNRRFGT